MCRKEFAEAAKRRLDRVIHSYRDRAKGRWRVLAAYSLLVETVRKSSSLLSRRAGNHGIDVNAALFAMAHHERDWLRSAEAWAPADAPPWLLLGSLAQHLFARYPMPRFMTSVWLEGKRGESLAQHRWYKHLGLGHNIRTADIPMTITRAMAHRFAAAPHHLTAVGALRWAQVLALGGEPPLAKAILATRLGRAIENEDFWETVVHFLVRNPDFDLLRVGPLVGFLQQQAFGAREGASRPTAPGFSMRGRTAAMLHRLVDDWQRARGQSATPSRIWPASTIRDFYWVDERRIVRDVHAWSIRELRTSDELVVEGRAMRHCVGGYVGRCVRRHSTIWSMRVETLSGSRRVLTIEVEPTTRQVKQAKRKRNEWPSALEREILARWAAREGLVLPEALRA